MQYNVFINGFPKTGNHALRKVCELLGVPAFVNHVPFKDGSPADSTHRLFIKRDPRNVIIPKMRMDGEQVTSGTFISKFRAWQRGSTEIIPLEDGTSETIITPAISTIEAMSEYEQWLNDADTFQVVYEDLIKNDIEMRRIATYLGTPYIEGAFEDLPGLTATWNDEHSDYNKIWTPEVDKVWNAEGGAELLTRWGY